MTGFARKTTEKSEVFRFLVAFYFNESINNYMDKEPSIMPDLNLFPRARKVAEYLLGSLTFIPDLGITHGDHFQKEREILPELPEQLESE